MSELVAHNSAPCAPCQYKIEISESNGYACARLQAKPRFPSSSSQSVGSCFVAISMNAFHSPALCAVPPAQGSPPATVPSTGGFPPCVQLDMLFDVLAAPPCALGSMYPVIFGRSLEHRLPLAAFSCDSQIATPSPPLAALLLATRAA